MDPSDAGPPADSATSDSANAAPPWWAIHRRMYDWVLKLAHSPNAMLSLFGISFAESSFFPIPPDVMLAPLCLGNRKKWAHFAAVTTTGSVLGAFLGYAIGYAFLSVALMIPGIDQAAIDNLVNEFQERGQLYVFVAALTPIPFKLLTITAGVSKMNLIVFGLACLVGRAIRFFAVAAIIWAIGPKAMPLIDKYFNWLCLAFVILLAGGFYVLKVMH